MKRTGFGTKPGQVLLLASILVGLSVWNFVTQWELAGARRLLKVYEEHAVQNSRADRNIMQFRHELMLHRSGQTNQFTGPR